MSTLPALKVVAWVAVVTATVTVGLPMAAIATADPAPACQPGYVWRAARPGDAVCVTPDIRDKTAQQNAAAPQNVQPNDGNVCKPGFVWRSAYPGDAVCVTPDVRDRAAADNAAAASHTVTNSGTCQKWRGATDELILAEDNGYKVFSYTSLTGQASFEGNGGPEVKGTITTNRGITGNSISFNVNWSNGWNSRYIGAIKPDGSAYGTFEDFGPPNDSDVHSGNWSAVGKFICDQ